MREDDDDLELGDDDEEEKEKDTFGPGIGRRLVPWETDETEITKQVDPAQYARDQSFARARGIAASQRAQREAAERAIAEDAARAEADRMEQLRAWKADPDWRGFEISRAHYAKHDITIPDTDFPKYKAYEEADRSRAAEQAFKEHKRSLQPEPPKRSRGMRR